MFQAWETLTRLSPPSSHYTAPPTLPALANSCLALRLKMLPARLLPPCFPAGPGTPPPLLLRSVQLFNYTAQPGQQPLRSLSVPANPAAHSYSLAVSLPGRIHLPPCAFPTHSIAAGISLVQYAPGVHGNTPHSPPPTHTHRSTPPLRSSQSTHSTRAHTASSEDPSPGCCSSTQ